MRIYYADGFVDDNVDRKRGVQAVVQRSGDVGWYVESHGDYYLKKGSLWHSADIDGLYTELEKRNLIRPTIGLMHEVWHRRAWTKVDIVGFYTWLDSLDWVLHGETIGNERFREIFQSALADADYGRRSGFLPGERKP